MSTEDQQPSFLEKFLEKYSPILQQYKNLLLYALIAIIALSLYGVYTYLQAWEKQKDQWQAYQEALIDLNSFKDIEKLEIAQKHSPLPYSAYLDQIVLALDHPSQNKIAQTTAFSQSFPFYDDYRQTSLLLASEQEDKWDSALQNSLNLHEKMRKNPSNSQQVFGLFLYSYNLMRLAFLAQKVDKAQLELSAWKDLEEVLFSSKKILESGYYPANDQEKLQQAFSQIFGESQASIKEYIRLRKELLSKKI